MALQKTPVPINFSKGLDTKSDNFQVSAGNFISLTNSVFSTTGRLTKRPGYPIITSLPNTSQSNLATHNGNLVATGSNLYSFNPEVPTWLDHGSVQPIDLETLPLVRSNSSQSSPDAATAPSGLSCLVYVDNSLCYYTIVDSVTGQNVVARTALPSTAVNPRVFVLGQYFIITFTATVAASSHLRYMAIPVAVPTSPGAPVDIATTIPSLTIGYDGYVANNSLYIAYTDTGTTIKVTYLTSSLGLASPATIASSTGDLISVTADVSASTPVIWVSWWTLSNTNGYAAAFNQILNPILAKTQFAFTISISELTSAATGGVCTFFYQQEVHYSYAPLARTDIVSKASLTPAGALTGGAVVLRSVGLASKAFADSDTGMVYMLVTFSTSNQPSYFLMDSSGNIMMRLAYNNGKGYASSMVLPSVSRVDAQYLIPYSIKTNLVAVNKGTALPSGTPTNGIYNQVGINLAKFTINDSPQYSSEIAGSLNLTGGLLWQFDGSKRVESGFNVYPEDQQVYGAQNGSMTAQVYYYVYTYEWTDNNGNIYRSAPSLPYKYEILVPPANFTGDTTNGSGTIANVSSFTGLQIGQAIAGTGIPAGAAITALDTGANTITIAPVATATNSTVTLTPVQVSATTSNVPTLRLTYKTGSNPVRIVGYRWSVAQQSYYQFTSITSPATSSTTTDSVQITDIKSDAQILGNALLYTTGGVVENIAPPACSGSVLYKNRLILIDAEDRNLLWYSKTVIEDTPVEMSDLFTIYVAPTSGAQGSTGPVTALSALDDKLIVFKRNAIYYITGTGPDNTGANNDFSDPVFITSAVGCTNPNSIVLMPNGIMFQSDKGIWLLGRDLSTSYIGSGVALYNNRAVRSASAIPGTNQVLFVIDDSLTLMYDYFEQQWGTFSNIRAVSATLYQGAHTYLNDLGQVLQQTPSTYLDGSSPVLMSFTTSWINLAGMQGYERFYFMYLLGTYITPFKLNVQLAYDYNTAFTQAIVITPDNYTTKWGDEPVWGAGDTWGGSGNVFEARLFPMVQKCEAFQITINEIYDASYGIAAGEGLTLSGMNMVVGTKKGYRVQRASKSFG